MCRSRCFTQVTFISSLTDVDGSEVLQVQVLDLPANASIDVTQATLTGENNSYMLSNESLVLGGFNVTLNDFMPFNLTLEATSTETSNNDSATVRLTQQVNQCGECSPYVQYFCKRQCALLYPVHKLPVHVI